VPCDIEPEADLTDARFEGHRVASLSELQGNKEDKTEKSIYCPRHKTDVLKFFCKTCQQPICKECTVFDHGRGHDCQFIMDIGEKQIEMMQHGILQDFL
jgi:tripartite motif-containing protein 2/3